MSDSVPIYVGNYQYDADERELEKTFAKYGTVKNIEYKPRGYCFVHYEDKRDAEEAIRGLDGREWGSEGRRLKVEHAKDDAKVRERQAERRAEAVPNETLFVAGFDPRNVTTEMLKTSFEGFGNLKRCEVKKTFAFVEYETIDDAKEALTAMHGSKIDDREITVEYVNKKPRERNDRDGDRRGGGDRRRGGGGGGGGGRDRDRPRSRYDDRRDDRGRDRDRRRSPPRGGGGRDYGGRADRYDDRDRRDGGGRRDDRRGGGGPGYGGGGGGRRDRSRSYERRDRRRTPPPPRNRGGGGGDGRARSPIERRGRSPPPRRDPPQERRPRSPMATDPPSPRVPLRRGDSPSRSRSPMRADD